MIYKERLRYLIEGISKIEQGTVDANYELNNTPLHVLAKGGAKFDRVKKWIDNRLINTPPVIGQVIKKSLYEGGSARSEKRLRYDLIPSCMIDGLAERFTIGAEKFGDNNWKLGGPKFFEDAKNHLMYHWLQFNEQNNDDEKDIEAHLKAIMWNAGILLWWEQNKDIK